MTELNQENNAGPNLLNDITYWSHVGENSIALSDIVDSGRTTLLTFKYNL